jgi:hypothetical protein
MELISLIASGCQDAPTPFLEIIPSIQGTQMKSVLPFALSIICHDALAAASARATSIVVDKSDHLMRVYAKDKIIATRRRLGPGRPAFVACKNETVR